MLTFADKERYIEQAQANLNKFKGAKEEIEETLGNTRKKIRQTTQQLETYEFVKTLFDKLGLKTRDSLTTKLENTVTRAIQETMGKDTLLFKIYFDEENHTQAEFKLIDTLTDQQLDIVNSFGGSLVHIINVVLRVMFAEVLQVQGPLIFDEPGTFIDAEKVARFGQFLKEISEKLDRQLVIVSHTDDIIESADVRFKVYKEGSVSKVAQEKK